MGCKAAAGVLAGTVAAVAALAFWGIGRGVFGTPGSAVQVHPSESGLPVHRKAFGRPASSAPLRRAQADAVEGPVPAQAAVAHTLNYSYNRGVFMTECVLDTVRAAAYLGTASTYIYRAASCQDETAPGCVAPIGHILQSLMWTGAFIVAAAQDCVFTLESDEMACAENILKEAAGAGGIIFGIEEDCFLSHEPALHLPSRLPGTLGGAAHHPAGLSAGSRSVRRLRSGAHHGLGFGGSPRRGALRSGAGGELVKAVGGDAGKARMERGFQTAQCSLDAVLGAAWLARAGMKIRQAALYCPDKFHCPISLVNMFAALSYASQFLSMLAVDCTHNISLAALCASDISDSVGSLLVFTSITLEALDHCTDVVETYNS